jgi:type IV secretory pathway VirB2 component (pilin)
MQTIASAHGAKQTIRGALSDRKSLGISVALMAVLMLFLFMPLHAHAQTIDLPWDSSMCKAAKAFTGPWLAWVAAIAVAIAGVAFGVGEAKAPLQTAMRIACGFSVAVAAVSVVGWLMPSASSYLQSMAC